MKVFLNILIFIIPLGTSAQSKCVDLFANNTLQIRQPNINQSNESDAVSLRIAENRFSTSRMLEDYIGLFGPEFRDRLEKLNSQSVWIDWGAGRGIALLEYMSSRKTETPTAIGVAIKRPPMWDSIWFDKSDIPYLESLSKLENTLNKKDKFIFIEGKWAEDISVRQFDLGTDVYGPFSYTSRLSDLLKNYFRFMKKETGVLYILNNKTTTEIILPDGRIVSIFEWLSAIQGIHVKRIFEVEDLEAIKISISKSGANVPELRIFSVVDGKPPKRFFRQVQ